jgi:hypothetical protein
MGKTFMCSSTNKNSSMHRMQQLTLFDTSSIVPSIKPGDWVKLRRKSSSAAYWKKGEIVQVQSVNPHTGCARFWNERAETWGYLHPEDVYLVPPPPDSVSVQPIALDTESTAPPADTESIAPSVEFDSVSVQPIALDTESTAPPADTESIAPPVEFDSVSGPVATYRPKGTARGGEYFRFSYRAGAKMKHLHIPGGNTGSVLAQSRAAEVMELAAAGTPLQDLVDLIKSWSGKAT